MGQILHGSATTTRAIRGYRISLPWPPEMRSRAQLRPK